MKSWHLLVLLKGKILISNVSVKCQIFYRQTRMYYVIETYSHLVTTLSINYSRISGGIRELKHYNNNYYRSTLNNQQENTIK